MLMALAVFNPFLLVQVQAQDEGDTWQHYYEMWMGDEEVEDEMAETLYDELAELSAHKINLNTATRADQQRMAFLTDKQINDIGEYVYRYGPVQSVAELSMVPTLDLTTLRLIQCFVYAGEGPKRAPLPPLDTLLRHTRSELTAAFRAPLYNRDGDLLGAKRGYLGPKYRHWLRFKTGYSRKLEVGLTAAQDAGEPFFTQQNRWGYDFYSFYAIMRNVGRIKTAVVGRYRARLGMGLILNTDFTLGKTMALGTLGRTENRLRAHSSRQESPYLQGAAATIQLTNTLELTTLFSIRNVDATRSKRWAPPVWRGQRTDFASQLRLSPWATTDSCDPTPTRPINAIIHKASTLAMQRSATAGWGPNCKWQARRPPAPTEDGQPCTQSRTNRGRPSPLPPFTAITPTATTPSWAAPLAPTATPATSTVYIWVPNLCCRGMPHYQPIPTGHSRPGHATASRLPRTALTTNCRYASPTPPSPSMPATAYAPSSTTMLSTTPSTTGLHNV